MKLLLVAAGVAVAWVLADTINAEAERLDRQPGFIAEQRRRVTGR